MSRLLITAALALAALPALAQTPARLRAAAPAVEESSSYWPLAVGNSWTYVETTSLQWFDAEPQQIRVSGEEAHNDMTYFQVEMFGRRALLRMSARGRVFEWVPERSIERLWYDFTLPAGGSWQPSNGDDCTGQAVISSRSATVTVPAGRYESALTVDYGPGPCADAGVNEEAFALGVGLLRRTITTIAGPRTFELRDAAIGGKVLRGPGLSFGLSVDRTTYTPNLMPPVDPQRAIPILEAQIIVENTTNQPLTLEFPSSQQFDLSIRNESGETVYFWSADKLFSQGLTQIELSPGRKTFAVSAPLGQGETPLPAGRYLVEAWLTTVGGKLYSATAPIEVAEPAF